MALGLQVPFSRATPRGRTTPEVQSVRFSAEVCRFRNSSEFSDRIFTSGMWGISENLSQQSPRVWLCVSGSKEMSSTHQLHAIPGAKAGGVSARRRRYSSDHPAHFNVI